VTWSRTFSRDREAPLHARRFVGGLAADRVSAQTLDDVLLMTSELVSNAVRHVSEDLDGTLEVTVSEDDAGLTITVGDPGPGFEHDEREDLMALGGRGLRIVDGLSSRWGVASSEQGTEVWFVVMGSPAASETTSPKA
jgi:anti-sigma regulatory factor (Ser/Thr protein kinase)